MTPIFSRTTLLATITGGLTFACMTGCTPHAAAPETNASRAQDQYVTAALAYNDGDRDRAMSALQAALKDNPDLIMARFLLGTIYKDKGEYQAAVGEFQRLTELDPYTAENHYNLGLMHHWLQHFNEAAVAYTHAVQLKPEDLKSNMYLGLVLTVLGKPEQGLPYSQKAVEIDPKSADARSNLAVVLDSMKDYAAAELAYRRALELDGGRTETALNLASNLTAQQKHSGAISVYEEILRTTDSTLIRQRFGNALVRAGRPQDALAQFDLSLKQSPQNYLALNGKGDAFLALYRASAMLDENKRVAALDQWNKSLAINPQQPRVSALVKEYSDNRLFRK